MARMPAGSRFGRESFARVPQALHSGCERGGRADRRDPGGIRAPIFTCLLRFFSCVVGSLLCLLRICGSFFCGIFACKSSRFFDLS